jgi:hypothetical protein
VTTGEIQIINLLQEITGQLVKILEILREQQKPYPPYVAKGD